MFVLEGIVEVYCSIQLGQFFYNWVLKNKLTSLLNKTFPLNRLDDAMTYKLTRLLEILGDGNWHETDQLSQQIELSDLEVQRITDFLGEYEFAEVDETKKRVRVNKDFQKILTQTK